MSRLFAKDLKIKFVETLNKLDSFTYEDGNPFLIRIDTNKYFIFLKNLSSAFFKNSPDVTRVQLPYSTHFSKIFSAGIPLIVLGYDSENDIFISWDPQKLKDRLNAKNNVSLYSRYSLQKEVKDNEFKTGYLSNGEKFILFRREFLSEFFDRIRYLFDEHQEKEVVLPAVDMPTFKVEISTDKLSEINDKTLLKEIKPLLKKNQVLQAVEITSNYFKDQYKNMNFNDWYKLINNIYKNMNSKNQS